MEDSLSEPKQGTIDEGDDIEDIDIDGIIYSLSKADNIIIDKNTLEQIGILKDDGTITYFKELEDIEQVKKSTILYNEFYTKEYDVGDIFILIYKLTSEKYDNEIIESICEIDSINLDDKNIVLKGDDDLSLTELEINDDNEIILTTDNYEIIDLDKVEEVEEKFLEDLELKLTKDLIKEILFEDIISDDRLFTDNERKEELLSELINLLDAYNNENLIKQLTEICDNYLSLIREKINNNLNNKELLEFVKNIINDNKVNFPKYIKPIVSSKRNLYVKLMNNPETSELEDPPDGINVSDLNDELNFLETTDIQRMQYREFLRNILSDDFQNQQINNDSKKFITKYTGEYLRDCLFEESCIGARIIKDMITNQFVSILHNNYSYDNIKNRNPLGIPILRDDSTDFEMFKQDENINIIGLLLYPTKYLDHLFNLDLYCKKFTLSEISFFYDSVYSYEIFKKRFKNDNVLSKVIDLNTVNIDDFNNEMICLFFDKNVIDIDADTFGTLLKNNLPNKRDLIGVIDENLIEKIYNINSFDKLLLNYNIEYQNLDNTLKKELIDKIVSNIKSYLSKYKKIAKPKEIKKIKIIKKKISQEERSKLSLKYILGLLNIKQKNIYLRKYVDLFLRSPNKDEDMNYLYNKYSNEKCLCKHYKYLMNIDVDNTSFDKMINIYKSDEIVDGCKVCKVCGEILCPEDFSPLQGFSDGKPTNTNEKLEQEEENVMKELTEEQFENKKLLALAAIGNPNNFFNLLENHNLNIKKKLFYPDHYKFSKNEITNILNYAEKQNYHIVMTEKDYFKFNTNKISELNYLKVSLQIDDLEELIKTINDFSFISKF